MRMMPRHHLSAFSLLEILIALGLFAIVITTLVSLFPTALRADKESDEETRSLFIATGVMEALPSADGRGAALLYTGMSNSLPLWENLSLGKSTNFSVAYNNSCEPIRQLTAEEAERPLPDHAALAIMTLSLISKSSLPGMITAEVSVASPASAPASGRTIRRFTRLLPVPAS
jgi:type II secretory pathway pseudopilin PulG